MGREALKGQGQSIGEKGGGREQGECAFTRKSGEGDEGMVLLRTRIEEG